MAKNSHQFADSLDTENTGGLLSGFLAEEEHLDRSAMLRLGTWGAVSVGAVIVAVLANQSSVGPRREQVAAVDLARQSQQIQSVAKESQNETRRLAAAIDTLNSDRDRLYSRVTVLEQGLDSVTGSIARQNAAAPPAVPSPVANAVAPAGTASPVLSPALSPPPASAAPVASTAPVAQSPAPAMASVVTTAAPTAAVAPPAGAPDKPRADAKSADTKAQERSPEKVQEKAQEKPPEKSVEKFVEKFVEKQPDAAPAAVAAVAPASSSPVAAVPAAPLMAPKSIMGPPDPAASKLIEPTPPAKADATAKADAATKADAAKLAPEVVASAPLADIPASTATSAAPPQVAVQRTEFGVDVGGANSVGGLRAVWRGLLKYRSNAPLKALQPIIMVKEGNNGLGMQLRLVAGPLTDAAAAAKICAVMAENQHPCETTVFDGQRLAMKNDEAPARASDDADEKPASLKPAKPTGRRRIVPKRIVEEEPPKKPETSTLSTFFRR